MKKINEIIQDQNYDQTILEKSNITQLKSQNGEKDKKEIIVSEEKKLEQLKTLGIPKRFLDKTFENYETKTIQEKNNLELVKNYAENFISLYRSGTSLILLGKPGTGKTHLACALANYLIESNLKQNKWIGVTYVSAMKIIRRIKDTYHSNGETEGYVINIYSNQHLLIIDEIGVQYGTEAEKMFLFEIINNRYEQIKPTVLISNCTLEELKVYIGERAVDRLKEGDGAFISFTGESYRGKNGN